MNFDRQKSNYLSSWWWTIDRVALFLILSIVVMGILLVSTSSPAIAERIGFGSFYFVKKQLLYLSIALVLVVITSSLSITAIRNIGFIGFFVGILVLILVLLFGVETNGARRWVSIHGFSMQPSEFMKPLFVIVTAWILSKFHDTSKKNAYKYSCLLYFMFAGLLILQPDFGMVVVVSAVWAGQLFISGLPLLFIAVFVVMGIIGAGGAYLFLPHVTKRVDSFLGLNNSEANFQVTKSLEAFQNGGILGKGPGEGSVKLNLPDAHTDFIFAVAGEELGAIFCILIVLLYASLVIRGLRKMMHESDLFIVYTVCGLLLQFGLQSAINMGVSLHLLPTKGMTLPFISYGGSSMLAISIAMGIILALTKKRYGSILKNNNIYKHIKI